MDRTILYVQAGEEPAQAVKSKFPDEDITFFIAKNAEEAFEVLKHNDIVVVLADCYLADMKLLEFIKKVLHDFPDTVMNVCLDVADPKLAPQIANIKGVKRIYLAPWELEEIEDGVRSSLDAACIDRDFAAKVRSLKEDEAQFEKTLEVLKDALLRQRYSYYKLSSIMKPYLEAAIAISNEEVSAKAGEGAEEALKSREGFLNFVRVSSEKMLRIMTTQKLSTEELNDYLRTEFKNALPKSGRIAVGDIKSCVMGEPDKNRLSYMVFSLWFTAAYQGYRLKKGTIALDSSYLSSSVCRYILSSEGEENQECPKELHDFVRTIISSTGKAFDEEKDGNVTRFIMDFEV